MALLDRMHQELNPPQHAAATHVGGPMLVFAGAGSGKTRVLTYRVAFLVDHENVQPREILCVTFTNKAAGEMRARTSALVGEARARDLWMSTFHSMAARLLRQHCDRAGLPRDFVIYDDADTRSVVSRICATLGIDPALMSPRAVLARIDRWKQELLSPDDVPITFVSGLDTALEIYREYELQLARNGALDFGDLLKKLVELLERDLELTAALRARFRHVMVDEFQDTNAAQYRLVRALVGSEHNVCVVGDDDQAIYGWRGADARNLGYFLSDFPEARIVKLEQNYRSTGNILEAANAVIAGLHRRESKKLFTRHPAGERIRIVSVMNERQEADLVASRIRAARARGASLSSIAVFYRVHAQSRALEEALRTADLPYIVVGGMKFYERAEVKDLHAYFRAVTQPDDDVSLLRIINTPARGIGRTTIDLLLAQARARAMSIWGALNSAELVAGFPAAARRKLTDFVRVLSGLQQERAEFDSRPARLARCILDGVGYARFLEALPLVERESRQQVLAELVGAMERYEKDAHMPSIADYLERITLAEDRSDAADSSAVSLMTVHSAKGLEFDTVLLTGMEEGMFPYRGADPGDSQEELDEERRLAYVAITRARRELVMFHAKNRQIFGTTREKPASRFIEELPSAVTDSLQATFDSRLRSAAMRPLPATPAPDGPRVVYDDGISPPPGSTRYGIGMRVQHPHFGVGTVRQVEQGAEPRLVVYFPATLKTTRILASVVRPVG